MPHVCSICEAMRSVDTEQRRNGGKSGEDLLMRITRIGTDQLVSDLQPGAPQARQVASFSTRG
jgi:hypothetical protein